MEDFARSTFNLAPNSSSKEMLLPESGLRSENLQHGHTLGTSDLLMPANERKQLLKDFVNPELCAISEDLVFTSPYIDSPSNDVDEAAAELAERLRRDTELYAESRRLLWAFRTQAEALIHGDLHTGSVMVSPE